MSIPKIVSQGISYICTKAKEPRFKWVFPAALFATFVYTAYKLCPSRVQPLPPPKPDKQGKDKSPLLSPRKPAAVSIEDEFHSNEEEEAQSPVLPSTPQSAPLRFGNTKSIPAALIKSPVSIEGAFNSADLTSMRGYNPPEDSLLHTDSNPDNLWGIHYLADWNRQYESSCQYGRELTTHEEMVLKRLQLYNETIRLRDRLCVMKDQHHLIEITVDDIECPWEDSGLKIALLSNEEVADLTFKEICNLSSRQMHFLNARASRTNFSAPVSDSPATIEGCKLAHFKSIPGAMLNKHLAEIPAEMLRLFSSEQLELLDVSALNEEQFKIVLGAGERLRKLPVDIFTQCFDRIVRLLPSSLDEISEEQVRSLNLGEKSSITKELVKRIAGSTGKLIGCLTTDQLIDGLSHDRFYAETAKWITADQVAQIDFRKVKDLEKRKEVIRQLFNDEKKIPFIQVDSINLLVTSIYAGDLRHMTVPQVQVLNLKDKAVATPEVLNGMCTACPSGRPLGYLMGFLTIEQLLDGLTHETLTGEAAKYVTAEQVAKMDFRKAKNLYTQRNKQVIRQLFYDEKKVPYIQVDSINLVVGSIYANNLSHMTQPQVAELNFKDETVATIELLNGMCAPVSATRPLGYLMRFLTTEQLLDGLSFGTLSGTAAKHVTADQVAKVDFRKAKNLEFRRPVINHLFDDAKNVPSIQVDSVNLVVASIFPNNLSQMTQPQVEALNFKDKNVATPKVLEGMCAPVSKERPLGYLIRFLTTQQLLDGLTHRTLTTDAAKYVTADQIAKFDFKAVDKQDEAEIDLGTVDKLDEAEIDLKTVNKLDEAKTLVRYLFDNEKNVPSIQPESVALVIPHIYIPYLKRLTKAQVAVLDFSKKGRITREMFEGGMLRLTVQFMSSAQIIDAIKDALFNINTIDFILDTQLPDLDLSLIKDNAIKADLEKRKGKL